MNLLLLLIAGVLLSVVVAGWLLIRKRSWQPRIDVGEMSEGWLSEQRSLSKDRYSS